MIVYLNGTFLTKSEASISPDDRGFMLADGVYEVVKVYKGKPFRMVDHMERLKNSLKAIYISGVDLAALESAALELLKKNALQDQFAGIYMQITRGAHPRMHNFPADIIPTVYISVFPFQGRFKAMKTGVHVITRQDIRWLRCNIKSIALLPNTLLYEEAIQEKASECLLIRNGNLTEASHSNVAGIKEGILYTHPDGNLVLPGITKKVVLEICRSHGIKVIEKAIPENRIMELDELMLLGTGNEVTPITHVDGKMIGKGMPGKITQSIQYLFFEETYGNLARDYWWKGSE